MSSEPTGSYSVGETSLVNFKDAPRDTWTTYIGRQNSYYNLPESEFANPFKLDDYSRDESVDLYTLWLSYRVTHEPSFKQAALDLRGETLACWCVPERCHGMPLVDFCESGAIDEAELERIRGQRALTEFPGVASTVAQTMHEAVEWLETV